MIGIQDQVKAQAEYIYRGNYGLTTEDEIIQTGIPKARARDIMRMKLRFAFDRIHDTEELIELRIVAEDPVELGNGALIQRKRVKTFMNSPMEKIQ